MADGIRIKIGLDGVQQTQAGAEAVANSLGKVGASQAKVSQQTFQAGQQLQDFFIQLQGGVNPLTALVQQGSQLTAVYGGVGNAVRGVVGLLTPLSVALGGAAAAAVATAVAYKQGAAESDAYARALILTGNAAGTTTGALKEMAKAQAAVAGTQGQAAAVLTQMAASGQVAATELSKAAAAAIKLERAGGPAAEETAKKFAELGKNPLQAVVRLNEAENFLTTSVYKQIRALELQGKTVEAAAVAQKAYADALEGRGGQLEARLGSIEKGWRSLKDAAKGAWDAMLNIGREDTLEEKLAKAQAAIEKARKLQRLPAFSSSPLADVAGAEAERNSINRSLLNRAEGAATERAAALETKKTIEQTTKALELQAAQAASAYAIAAARIKGEIEQIQSAAKRGLLGPIEAIEKEGDKRVELLKAERQQLVANLAVAKQTVGGQVQVAQITGQIAAKDIELNNERVATQNRVTEAIYATKKAADAFYEAEREANRADLAKLAEKLSADEKAATAAVAEYVRSIDDANAALETEIRLIGLSEQARSVQIEKLKAEVDQRKQLEALGAYSLAPEQRSQLDERVREATARRVAAAEAKAYMEEYQRVYDDISQGLTDALIEGGKSARDYLKGLFRNLVLQPLLRPLVSPVSALIANATAGTAGGGLTGQALQGVGLANNIYQAYSGGGLAGSALAAGNYAAVYSGQAYGTAFGSAQSSMLAAQEAGMVSQAGASSMAGWASTAGWIAAAVVAAMQGSADWSSGFRRDQARDSGTVLGEASYRTADLFARLGVSDRWADILSGATLTARAFGRRAPTVEEQGITGTLAGGGFSGQAYANIVEKGGWFRSDKRYTEFAEANSQISQFIGDAAKAIYTQTEAYGKALGLPAEALTTVSTDIKVALGDDEQANQKAIAEAFGGYGEALAKAWATALQPVAQYGEAAADTVARVAIALTGVNDVLEGLGLAALQSSVDGAKAALALQDLFGGASNFAQSAASYYQKFYTEAERADIATAQITETLGKLGLAFPKTRDEFRALVDDAAKSLDTDAGRQTFATLLSVADGIDALYNAAGNASRSLEDIVRERKDLEAELLRAQGDTIALRKAEREAIDESNRALYDQIKALEDQQAMLERQRSLASGVDAVAGDFLGGADLANYKASRIVDILKEGGIDSSVQGILGSTRADILSLWQAVGIDGREAILSAYSAWEDLQEILYGTQRAVDAYRGGTLADSIERARLNTLTPAARAARLRGTEADLFSQLSTAEDPIALAQRLTEVITERLSLEASLTQSVGEQRLDTLREELDAQKAIRDVVAGLPQFTASLRFSDVSPLSAQQQLGEAQKLFESTLTRTLGGDKLAAANLQTNAQAYISEAISAYGSGPQAASVFTRVTDALDQVAAQLGPVLAPQIAALESQVTSLSSIDETAGGMLAALLSIDAILAGRGTGGTGAATTPADPLADIGNTAGAVTGAIANAADTTTQAARVDAVAAQLATVAGKLDAISANTRPIAAGVAVDQEGYTQMVARQRALEAKLDELLAVVRYGQTATT